MTNNSFDNNRERATEILQIVHTDLNGPHHIISYKGEKYFFTFVDDYSKCAKIYSLKTKDELINWFKDYVNFAQNKFGKYIERLQCDKGTGYLNLDVYDFVRDKGIELLPRLTGVHELNGVAERYNRLVIDVGRCLCKEAQKDKKYCRK